jgi:hypothetical protein
MTRWRSFASVSGSSLISGNSTRWRTVAALNGEDDPALLGCSHRLEGRVAVAL